MGQIGLDGQALALHSFATNGFLYRTGNSTFTAATSGSLNAPTILAAAPTTSKSSGVVGQIAFGPGAGSTFLYACTATGTDPTLNRWGRVSLATF